MGEAIVLAHTRMGYPYAYGQPMHARTGRPCIRIWAASTRMGCPYAYGTAHTRMGRIPVWDGTEIIRKILLGILDLGFQARFHLGFQHLRPRFQLVADPRLFQVINNKLPALMHF